MVLPETQRCRTGFCPNRRVAGRIRRNFIRILPGDIVTVAISPYDMTKGRITYRGPLRLRPDAATAE